MKEPWETLLGQYRDHWFLGDLLDDQAPPVGAIMADERWFALSHGEQAMVLVASAILQINQAWLAVDDTNRARIDRAIRITVDA